jgi:hypothetical protein
MTHYCFLLEQFGTVCVAPLDSIGLILRWSMITLPVDVVDIDIIEIDILQDLLLHFPTMLGIKVISFLQT